MRAHACAFLVLQLCLTTLTVLALPVTQGVHHASSFLELSTAASVTQTCSGNPNIPPPAERTCCAGRACPYEWGVCCASSQHCCPAGAVCLRSLSGAPQLCGSRPLSGQKPTSLLSALSAATLIKPTLVSTVDPTAPAVAASDSSDGLLTNIDRELAIELADPNCDCPDLDEFVEDNDCRGFSFSGKTSLACRVRTFPRCCQERFANLLREKAAAEDRSCRCAKGNSRTAAELAPYVPCPCGSPGALPSKDKLDSVLNQLAKELGVDS